MTDRCFEDFAIGDRFTSPGITVSEGQILDFALAYDPQPFHLDKLAAERDYPYGGLIASGFHTLAITFRALYQTGWLAGCGIGSPGMERVNWLVPVRPDDTLVSHAEILDAKSNPAKPDRGYIKTRQWATNQHGETVIELWATVMVRTRQGVTEAAEAAD